MHGLLWMAASRCISRCTSPSSNPVWTAGVVGLLSSLGAVPDKPGSGCKPCSGSVQVYNPDGPLCRTDAGPARRFQKVSGAEAFATTIDDSKPSWLDRRKQDLIISRSMYISQTKYTRLSVLMAMMDLQLSSRPGKLFTRQMTGLWIVQEFFAEKPSQNERMSPKNFGKTS